MTSPQVFMVDDNRHELQLGDLAFAEIGISVDFVGLENAETAVERLRALAADPSSTPPKLVLLDLNMPRIPGGEILAFMKGHPRLRSIPVVILTTSNADADRTRCLALGADEFCVKPHRLAAYLELFSSFRRYLDRGAPGEPAGPAAGGAVPDSPAPLRSSASG